MGKAKGERRCAVAVRELACHRRRVKVTVLADERPNDDAALLIAEFVQKALALGIAVSVAMSVDQGAVNCETCGFPSEHLIHGVTGGARGIPNTHPFKPGV